MLYVDGEKVSIIDLASAFILANGVRFEGGSELI
jgi:hypothetical protein